MTSTREGGHPGFLSADVVGMPAAKQPLTQTHPGLIAAEWDYDRNAADGFDPALLTSGSDKRAWRRPACCGVSYQARIKDWIRKGSTACPVVHNNLTVTHPELMASEWDFERNSAEGLDPAQLTYGSSVRAWRRPPCCGAPYRAVICAWFGPGRSACPVVHNSLTAKYPDLLAAEWDYERNTADGLDPSQLRDTSSTKAWRRPSCCGVSYQASVHIWFSRRQGSCPVVHNNLTVTHPELLAAEWDYERNAADGFDPEALTAGSGRRPWRRPSCCGVSHQVRIADWFGAGKANCPVVHTNLTVTHPQVVASEWDFGRNAADGLDPAMLTPGSKVRAWRRPPCCGVSYRAIIGIWFGKGQVACPIAHQNLTVTHPDLIAGEWDFGRNAEDGLDPAKLTPGSQVRAWRRSPCCGVSYRVNVREWTRGSAVCPCQNQKWTVVRSRAFLESLLAEAASFSEGGSLSPAEVWTIADRAGILDSYTKQEAAKRVLAGAATGRDWETLTGSTEPIGSTTVLTAGSSRAVPSAAQGAEPPTPTTTHLAGVGSPSEEAGGGDLPALSVLSGLKAGLGLLPESADAKAIQFLVDSAVGRLWARAYADEVGAVADADAGAASGSEYVRDAAGRFSDEYRHARSLTLPDGWAFAKGAPNLMQWHVASQVIRDRRVGNWSQAGTGKTLSAVLASRLVGADLTVVVCPNAVTGRNRRARDRDVLSGWVEAVRDMLGDSVEISTGTLAPVWNGSGKPRFLIVQVEAFQRDQALDEIAALTAGDRVGMVVIDEAHYLKRRGDAAESRRRENVAALLTGAAEATKDLAVLAMTATPVVNELSEALSILTLLGSDPADGDLPDAGPGSRETVARCMDVHQRLVRSGTRFRTADANKYKPTFVSVDASAAHDDLLALGRNAHAAHIEQVLTRARIPAIVAACRKGPTMVYTEHVDGIVEPIAAALRAAGLTVALQTGGVKEIEEFKSGRADVLIGSSAVSTGVDGLQHRAHRLVLNSLPWTGSAWEQLVARLDRTGQTRPVEITIPSAYINTPSGRWEWDANRWARISNKRTIADAAVDGHIPLEEDLRSPQRVTGDLMAWLTRLDAGEQVAA